MGSCRCALSTCLKTTASLGGIEKEKEETKTLAAPYNYRLAAIIRGKNDNSCARLMYLEYSFAFSRIASDTREPTTER